jgi:tetratricopeptide (TPR) repeat protein
MKDKLSMLFRLIPVLGLISCAGMQGPVAVEEPIQQAEALQINPLTAVPDSYGEASYNMLVAELALNRGQNDLAIIHYLKLAESQSNPAIAERAVRVAVFGKNLDAAVRAAERWLELEPDRSEAQQIIAAVYIRQNQVEEAYQYIESLIESTTMTRQQIFVSLLGVLLREKNTETVMSVTRKLAERYSDDPYAHYLHGMLSAQGGRSEEALKHLNLALAETDIDGAHNARAKVLLKLGRPSEALVSLRHAVEKSPDDNNLRLSYARLLVDVKQYEKARLEFERLYRESPNDEDLLYTLGLLSLESGRLDDAESYFLKLLAAKKREGETQYYLGRIYENRKEYSTSIDWYNRVHVGEYQFDARLRIADLLRRSGQFEKAREHLNSMLKGSQSDGSLVRIYLAEGELLRSANQYEEAMAVYDKALGIVPGNNDLLYARALTAEKVGRTDILERDLQAILKTEPDNAHALNALGFTLADRTDRYEEALGYIKRAMEIMPDDPAIIDSLGWVYYKLGRFQESVKWLRRALTRFDDAEIAAHLGEVLWVSGEKLEAREIWQKALQKSPDEPLLIDVMKRFIP